ncbi:alpha/beta fold hydrolase [Brevibacillus choshinensis]|uniref:Alpha/beta hydrolase n=1 Tax=Brevibacillus choshinensis TaxID=54911 RepID=A0ABX7FP38_BRECH|nr:alpha/beta hydrolase [Brevibacillus choshinensis]QRG67996.1 alpha/beta hydrolase [Brevibacillus choshinensis]
MKLSISLKTGIEMKYVEAGPPDAPVLILLHGLTDSSRSWSLSLPKLAENYHVYVLDQRGHGDSDAPDSPYRLSDFAEDVISFMDALSIEKASIAGHSMGSFVAQLIAITHPQCVTNLVLVGSADKTAGNETLDWLWENIQQFQGKVDPAFLEEWTSTPTPVDPEFLARLKEETAAVPVYVWKHATQMLMTEDFSAHLSEIKVPTFIIWGEQDAVFPYEDQVRLQAAIPQAKFQSYPDVGHNIQWEIPQQIGEDIASFVKENL